MRGLHRRGPCPCQEHCSRTPQGYRSRRRHDDHRERLVCRLPPGLLGHCHHRARSAVPATGEPVSQDTSGDVRCRRYCPHRAAQLPDVEYATLPPCVAVFVACSPRSARLRRRHAVGTGAERWRLAGNRRPGRPQPRHRPFRADQAASQHPCGAGAARGGFPGADVRLRRCRMEELEKFIMPALLVATAEDPAMVAVTIGATRSPGRASQNWKDEASRTVGRRWWRMVTRNSTSAPGMRTTPPRRPSRSRSCRLDTNPRGSRRWSGNWRRHWGDRR